MANPTHVADLFLQEPAQWGLRGDPWLWRAMRDRLEDVPMPDTASEMTALLEDAFAAEVGIAVSANEGPVFVERFAHGGLSSGHVDPGWWSETGIPLLSRRWVTARR